MTDAPNHLRRPARGRRVVVVTLLVAAAAAVAFAAWAARRPIGSPAGQLVVRVYDVRDLLDGAESAADRFDPGWRARMAIVPRASFRAVEIPPASLPAYRVRQVWTLVKLVCDTTQPGSWLPNGGDGRVDRVAGALAVRQTVGVQRDVSAFLDHLRRPVPIGGPSTVADAVEADRAAGTVTRVYDVGPLLARTVGQGPLEDRLNRIQARLEAVAAPGSWRGGGGDVGVMWPFNDRLAVMQTATGHRAVAAALAAMRDER